MTRVSFFSLLLLFFSACQNQSFDRQSKAEPAPPPATSAPTEQGFEAEAGNAKLDMAAAKPSNMLPEATYSSAVARMGKIDSLKRLVRTADLQFRVKNVPEATLHIENIGLSHQGFILQSNLNTVVEYQRTEAMNRDSSLETTRYIMQNDLVLRVPVQYLDTTLRLIGRLADFWDHRNIKAEEMELRLLEEELNRIRQGIYTSQLEQNRAGAGKISDKNESATLALEGRAQADQSRIERLKIEDQIRYSTVRIQIHSLPQIKRTMVANTEIHAAQQPFFARIGEALLDGWELVAFLFLGLLRFWSVGLLGGGLFWGLRKWRSSR